MIIIKVIEFVCYNMMVSEVEKIAMIHQKSMGLYEEIVIQLI